MRPNPFLTPTIKRAQQESEALAAGTAVSTLFSGDEWSALIGVFGASFVVKLEKSCRPYIGFEWLKHGQRIGDLTHVPRYGATCSLLASKWLIDIAVRVNWFHEHPSHQAMSAVQARPLEGDYSGITHQIPVSMPKGVNLEPDSFFALLSSGQQTAEMEHDIPLASWLGGMNKIRAYDFPSALKASPLAFVIYARFQRHDPQTAI